MLKDELMEKDIILTNENGSWHTLSTRKWSQRKPYEAANEKEIRAALPGIIVKIFVSEGEEVKEGAPLLELEAMKMVSTLTATKRGKIKAVNTKAGEEVHKNELLISFD